MSGETFVWITALFCVVAALLFVLAKHRRLAHYGRARDYGLGSPPRETGVHPGLGMGYGSAAPRNTAPAPIILTPRQLERVNIQRKLNSRPPLNRAGFENAVAHAATRDRQPDTSANWLTYLILYEAFFDDHKTNRVACDASIAIRPGQPFNGHGGEFAGAGASGDWTSPPSALAAAGAAIALTPDYADTGRDNDWANWPSGGDPAPALLEPAAPIIDRSADGNPESYIAPASAPDPSPSYSAPDPSPPSFDSGGGGGGSD